MLHQDMMFRFHRDDTLEVDRLISRSRPAAAAEPAFSPWALAAAVAGNVIAGGLFLGTLILLPYWVEIVVG